MTKEEIKQSEGDPLVKSKIRQIQRQIAQRRMMQEVPKADVVITNPTHVAVALRYDKATMAASVVIAKGYDEVAQRIKAIAAENGIVQVENIALARALAKNLDVGDAVPAKWYQAVAEILSMVYKLKKPAAWGDETRSCDHLIKFLKRISLKCSESAFFNRRRSYFRKLGSQR